MPLFGSETWVTTPLTGEGPQGFPLPGGTDDGKHGTQWSTGQDMGVPTHCGGASNGGDG